MQLVHVKQLKHAFKIQIFFLNLIEFCPCDHFSITYTHTATHSHVATSTFVLCVKEYIIDWSHVTANNNNLDSTCLLPCNPYVYLPSGCSLK